MKITNGKCFLLLLIPFFSPLAEGKTRQEVIKDAEAYSSYNWTPSKNNLLDVKTCIDGVGKIDAPEGDEVDDRRQVYDSTTKKCSEVPSLWPFVNAVHHLRTGQKISV